MLKALKDVIAIEDVPEVTLTPKRSRKQNKVVIYEKEEDAQNTEDEEEEVPQKKQSSFKKAPPQEPVFTANQVEAMLESMSKKYLQFNMKDSAEDSVSESDCRSTDNTCTTETMRDEEDYVEKGAR